MAPSPPREGEGVGAVGAVRERRAGGRGPPAPPCGVANSARLVELGFSFPAPRCSSPGCACRLTVCMMVSEEKLWGNDVQSAVLCVSPDSSRPLIAGMVRVPQAWSALHSQHPWFPRGSGVPHSSFLPTSRGWSVLFHSVALGTAGA